MSRSVRSDIAVSYPTTEAGKVIDVSVTWLDHKKAYSVGTYACTVEVGPYGTSRGFMPFDKSTLHQVITEELFPGSVGKRFSAKTFAAIKAGLQDVNTPLGKSVSDLVKLSARHAGWTLS